jgi:hypothetical protein
MYRDVDKVTWLVYVTAWGRDSDSGINLTVSHSPPGPQFIMIGRNNHRDRQVEETNGKIQIYVTCDLCHVIRVSPTEIYVGGVVLCVAARTTTSVVPLSSMNFYERNVWNFVLQ